MEHNELKTKLLNLKVFEDNLYFNKYIELIINNLNTRRQIHKTQLHHIIPKCYYKINNLEINNKESNLVNLYYKDHLLAHYYLALCMKAEYKYRMIAALDFITGNIQKYNKKEIGDIKSFLNKLEHYQTIYEETIKHRGEHLKGKPKNPESELKRLETRRLKGIGKHSEITKQKMRHSHIMHKKREPMSDETKAKLKKAAQNRNKQIYLGKIWINNGVKSKFIYEKELSEYLNKGFVKGRLKLNISERGMLNIKLNGQKIGKLPKSNETKRKISESLRKKQYEH